jgi:hypothetical protein
MFQGIFCNAVAYAASPAGDEDGFVLEEVLGVHNFVVSGSKYQVAGLFV